MKRKNLLTTLCLIATFVILGNVGWAQTWVETALSDLTSTDVFLIVDKTSGRAMSNNNGTTKAPDAISVTISGNQVTAGVADTIMWQIGGTTNAYIFYPNGTSDKWLYCTSTNNGVRVGTNLANTFKLYNTNWLQHIGTSRYVGVYNNQDWRCYTSVTGTSNIANTVTAFYKLTASNTPPTWTATYPKTANVFNTTLDLLVNTDKPGTAYYVVLANGAAAPTAAEVKAGTGSSGVAAIKNGSIAIAAASTDYTANITGLTAVTTYDIYVVAEDNATTPNLQTTPTMVTATTADPNAHFLTITAPTAATLLYAGETTTVTWTSVNMEAEQVKVELGTKNGASYDYQVLGTTTTAGSTSLEVTIPASTAFATTYTIRISESDDASIMSESAPFKIRATSNNLATVRTLPVGTELKYTGSAIVTASNAKKKYYIADSNGAILLHSGASDLVPPYNQGDALPQSIVGTISVTNNMIQLTLEAHPGPATTTGNTTTPIEKTIPEILPALQAQLVTIKNVQFDNSVVAVNFASNKSYSVTDGTNSIVWYSDFANANYIGTAIPKGRKMNLTCIAYQYVDVMQIMPRSLADIYVQSNNDTLATLELGATDVLTLEGITGTESTLAGATLNVNTTELATLTGIALTTDSDKATYTVQVNGTAVAAGDLATTALADTDVVLVTVTAEDGNVRYYKVTVNHQKSNLNAITAYSIAVGENNYTGIVDGTAHTVNTTVPYGTNVTALVATFSLSQYASAKVGATAQVSGTTPNNFTSAVTYTVTAEDGTPQDWTVTVECEKNTATEITAFSIAGQVGTATISGATIAVTMPYGTTLTALVPTFTLSDQATATVGGAAQTSGTTEVDFTNPVTYVVTAGDGTTTQNWTVTVTCQLNSEANFLTFTLTNATAAGATIDNNAHTIAITMVSGTEVTALAPTFTLSAGATAKVGATEQVSGVTTNDFTNPVVYTVTAENGTATQDWTVTVTVEATLSDENAITAFAIGAAHGVINATDHTIAIEVPYGTDVTALTPTITVSAGASISPTGAQNFSSPVTYTVTAQNNATQTWTVTVTVKAASTGNAITSFTFPGEIGTSVIDPSNHTIAVTVPYSTSISSITPTIAISENASISPTGAQDFTSPVTYTVTSQSGVAQTWTVNVTVAPNTANAITAFSVAGVDGTINTATHTVAVTVPYGTDVTALTPTITVSAEATIAPESGVAQNFTSPVTYTVTSQSGAAQAWVVTVTFVPNTANAITAFSVAGADGTIDATAHTVAVTVPYGTNVTALTPTITVSGDATISPASGVAQDFTSPVTYTVTSQSGVPQAWEVTVTVAQNTENAITSFVINGVVGAIDAANHTVTVELPNGTNVTALTPTITISGDATISPASGVAQDFTNAVTYTVTSQSGVAQAWVVTVNLVEPKGLFISEYLEGSSSNKAIELYNPTSSPVNLNNYVLRKGTNGANFSTIFKPKGILAPGDVYVIANSSAHASIKNVADTLDAQGSIVFFNGNDAVGLFKIVDSENILIDVIGLTTGDPGTGWPVAGVANATADHTLVRKNSIVIGNTNWNASAGTTADNSEWIIYGEDNFNFIGWHIASNKAEMLTFSVPGQVGATTINSVARTISAVVPYGTDLTALVPTFTVSEHATANPASGVAQNFTSPVTYTVTAENGTTTKTWTATITTAQNTQNAITAFSVAGVNGTIDAATHTVAVTVPYGTDVTALTPTIAVSGDATISPASGVAQNFTNAVNYTVTSQSGAPQAWTVTVTIAPNTATEFVTFTVANIVGSATIDATAHTITATVAVGTDLTTLAPTFTLSAGATANPASDVAQDFTNPVAYTVTAQDGTTTKTWTVTITKVPASSEKDILSFAVSTISGTISGTNIAITMPLGTDVTAIAPTITVSDFATVSPASGVAQDFTNPVTYTVTAQDGSTKDYTATITVSTTLSDEANILSFVIDGNAGVINTTNHTIGIEMPMGTDLTALTPTIGISYGATVVPASGVAQNFTNPVTYTVTAQDGTTVQAWVVTAWVIAKDLFISEYLEGTGNHKAIELYNPTDQGINLSNYVLRKGTNGAAFSTTFKPKGTLKSKGVYVIANGGSNVAILNVADTIDSKGSIVFYNGDDAVGLFKVAGTDTTLIDVVGLTNGIDPGDGWPVAGVTNATKNNTLVRKDNITIGNTNWNTSAGTTADNSEWMIKGEDNFSFIGWHIVNSNAEIVTFSVPSMVGVATINSEAGTITAQVISGTDLTTLVPTFTLSGGATSTPASGVAQDFTNPVTYTVTAQNGTTTKTWTVTITAAAEVPYASIYEIQYTTDPSGNSPLVNQTVATSGIVTAMKWNASTSKCNFAIQNGTQPYNGIYVYNASTQVAVGDSVRVIGKVVEFNGLTELTNPTATIISSNHAVPAPIALTTLAANGEGYEGMLIKVSNATVANNKLDDGSGPLAYYGTFYSFTFVAGKKYNVTGVALAYNGAQICPRNASDVEEVGLPTAAEMLTFSVPGMIGTATINSTAGTVSAMVPTGTDLTALVPTFTVSSGATANPASGVAQNFTNPVAYTVTAQDGTTTKTWTVTITSVSTSITSIYDIQFTTDPSGNSPLIDQIVTTTGVVTAVKWTASTSKCNFAIQNGTSPYNGIYVYSAPTQVAVGDSVKVTGKVVEYNGLTELTNPTATIISSNHAVPAPIALTTLAANGEGYEGMLVKVTNATAAAGANANTWILNDGSGAVNTYSTFFNNPFSAGKKYNVTGIALAYNAAQICPRSAADVTEVSTPTEAEILTFSVPGMIGTATISSEAATITAKVPTGTNLTALVPTFTVSSGATSNPVSGVAQNFTNPVTYTVTAQDGTTTKTWTVTITQGAVTITPIYDIQYTTDPSGNSPLLGQIVTTKGIVTANKWNENYSNGNFTIQDGTTPFNGLYIYRGTTQVAVGDSVKVTGKVDEYKGLTELKEVSNITIISSGNTLPSPIEVSTLDANKEDYESMLVKVSKATLTNGKLDDGSGPLVHYTAFYTHTFEEGKKYNVTGVMLAYDVAQICPRSESDISDVTAIDINPLSQLRVYPNPFSNEIRFDGATVKRVTIISTLGQVVIDRTITNGETISTSELPTGIYLVRFANEMGRTSVHKMIKQ